MKKLGEEEKKLYKRLHSYIEKGDVISCDKLYKEHPQLDLDFAVGQEHYTPLHKTCYYGHVECLHWLVWNVADLSKKTLQGWTPAHISAIQGTSQCMEALAVHGADFTIRDEAGQCAIHLATAHGNNTTLQILCRKGYDIRAEDGNGWRPVHHAAYNGKLSCLQTLVRWGCDLVCLTGVTGNTPLHLAAERAHPGVLKYIMTNIPDLDANLDAVNNDGMTPIDLARMGKHDEILAYLLDHKGLSIKTRTEQEFPVHFAAGKGDLDTVKRLICCGACDVDSRDNNGSTPAHKAAGNGQLEVMKWLLDHDCDLTAKNNDEETPKDTAKRFGKHKIVELLGGYTDEDDTEEEDNSGQNREGDEEAAEDLTQVQEQVTVIEGHLLEAKETLHKIINSLHQRKNGKEEQTTSEYSDDDEFEDWVRQQGVFKSTKPDAEPEPRKPKKKVRKPRKVITRGVFVKNL